MSETAYDCFFGELAPMSYAELEKNGGGLLVGDEPEIIPVKDGAVTLTFECMRQVNDMTEEKYDALTSIPGIGPICAITLLTEIYDVKRFKNERQFASYLGLVPTCHSSGEKASFGEMTFRGNKHLGPLLIEASWVAIHWDDALSVAFTNYRRKGLMPQESIIRVARKLSNIIFSMLKTGNHYAPANA